MKVKRAMDQVKGLTQDISAETILAAVPSDAVESVRTVLNAIKVIRAQNNGWVPGFSGMEGDVFIAKDGRVMMWMTNPDGSRAKEPAIDLTELSENLQRCDAGTLAALVESGNTALVKALVDMNEAPA